MGKVRKSKRQKKPDVPSDLITELPRHVIDVIMEHLPLYDVARMSVLSHKWLNIWRSIPKLVFDTQFFKQVFNKTTLTKVNTLEFYNIVSRILLQHSGQILRFHVNIPRITSCPDLTPWIYYLSKNGVSDICIQNQYQSPHKLSSHIFSCGNLEKLKLQSCIINPPHNFKGFGKMTCLDLDKTSLSSKAFKILIRGSPLLQELRLTNFNRMQNVKIIAPNLCHLVVDGPFKKLYVRNAEKLVSAVICLQNHVEVSHQDRLRVLLQALATSSKLQKLAFGGHFVKTIYGMILRAPTFEKLKNLELSSIHLNEVKEFCSIISIIQKCPAIERLNISVSTSKNESDHQLEYNSSFVLQRLCYANVKICNGSNMELRLIEFLLKCSPILKELSITASANSKRAFTQPVMFELVSFYRASQNVKIRCLSSVIDVSSSDSSSDDDDDSSKDDDSSEDYSDSD
ncbi:F-box/FBD/LRR-repeat protein At1g13570-like [Silene latifolia]|uniref:F-box/FBD/LRR-repeat protein At1g13570-like n=1 Tax=Silene latifolia TaxID=37657 RepID=UPI003D76B1A6